jgi:DNA-binding CsgD family transcriptional regulator/Flp pilus assembly protein TadD
VPSGVGVSFVERERELEAIVSVLALARRGEGVGLLVEGPPGIGKSRLLAEARAQADGFRVVTARGSTLELGFPFGVVRQLFEPVLGAVAGQARTSLLAGAAGLAEPVLTGAGGRDAETQFAAMHGLYWLVVNVAEASPLLIVVDDVQWADAASLRWLIYLAGRLEGLRVALVAATRPPESLDAPGLLVELTAGSGMGIVRPRELSEPAIAGLVEAELKRRPDDAFVAACRRASDGNPFLLHQLLGEVSRAAIEPVQDSAQLVAELGSRDVARMLLARLSDSPAGCVPLARAVAVLGDGAPVGFAARLAGLEDDNASRLADRLTAVDILQRSRPLAFVHPLVRTSVLDSLAPGELAAWHSRAADLLAAEGAEDERVALHVMECDARGDAARVEVLRRAAASASRRGAVDVAVAYLRRALEEPPGNELLPPLAHELGAAAFRAGALETAIEQLGKASREDPVGHERSRAANTLATALYVAGRPEEAVSVLSAVIDALPASEREDGLRLQAARWVAGRTSGSAWRAARKARDRFAAMDAAAITGGERLAQGVAALHASRDGTADDARELALRAFADGELLADPGPEHLGFWVVPFALLSADALEDATRAFSQVIDWGAKRGSLPVFSAGAELRGYCSWRRGSLDEAEADAGHALDPAVFAGTPLYALATLAHVLLERGRVAEAGELLARGQDHVAGGRGVIQFLEARARVRVASQDVEEALDDLNACGRLEDEWEVQTPSLTSWRCDAALALSSLGRPHEADRLARDELERSRAYGARRPLGIALRTLGMLTRAPEGLELLEQAVDVHESSDARLEHARSLAELGAALRRAGHRREARDRLRSALDLAARSGAEALAGRTHAELVAAGARPRRDPTESRVRLTASELRVARLAAEGMSNREVAQSLFLTEKTIENHLTSIYRKLDIGSRSQLARALSPQSAAVA